MKVLGVFFLIVSPIVGIFVMGDKILRGGVFGGAIGIVLAVLWLVFLYNVLTFTSDASDAERAKQEYERAYVERHGEVLQAWDRWNRGAIDGKQYHAIADEFEAWKNEQHKRLAEIESKFTNNISRFS